MDGFWESDISGGGCEWFFLWYVVCGGGIIGIVGGWYIFGVVGGGNMVSWMVFLIEKCYDDVVDFDDFVWFLWLFVGGE